MDFWHISVHFFHQSWDKAKIAISIARLKGKRFIVKLTIVRIHNLF